jgi:hypothetical protein
MIPAGKMGVNPGGSKGLQDRDLPAAGDAGAGVATGPGDAGGKGKPDLVSEETAPRHRSPVWNNVASIP